MIIKILPAILLVSLATAQTQESFDELLTRCKDAWLRSKRKEAIANWEGLKTWDGFNLVIGELLTGPGGNRRTSSFAILEQMQLPREEMVERLLNGAKAALDEPGQLPPHLAILEEFSDDRRIIEWLGGLMNDRRQVPEPKRKRYEDRSGGELARVCDCASGTITRMLIASKKIPYEGLGVGDPNLEYTYEKRDLYNMALAKKLIELGFAVKEPTLKPRQPPVPRDIKPRVEIQNDPRGEQDK